MSTEEPLTKRERDVVRAIRSRQLRCGYPPTVRELCRDLGVASPHAVHCHLKSLRRKRVVRWRPRKFRTLQVCE